MAGVKPRMNNLNEAQRKMVHLVIAAGNYVHNSISAHIKPFGLSLEQYNVMEILSSHYPRPITFTAIQEQMNYKSSNVTRLVDKLVDMEFVTREINPEHRRKMNIAITGKGMNALQKIESVLPKVYAEFEHLSKEEVAQLNALLEKLKK